MTYVDGSRNWCNKGGKLGQRKRDEFEDIGDWCALCEHNMGVKDTVCCSQVQRQRTFKTHQAQTKGKTYQLGSVEERARMGSYFYNECANKVTCLIAADDSIEECSSCMRAVQYVV